MGSGDETAMPGLKSADPFQFRKHGLEGKVIGALFALVFILLAAIGYGGLTAAKLGEQLIVSNKNVADAVKGVSVGLYELGQYVAGEKPRNPVRQPAAAPAESNQ